MAYDIKLGGKNEGEALYLLETVAKVLDEMKIDYWLEGGTLLGVRRENRLLPWDNDVDLSMMVQGNSVMNALVQSLKRSKLRVRVRKFLSSQDWAKAGDIRIIKIRKKSSLGLIKGKVCLEIFVKYQKEQKVFWQIGEKIKNVPAIYYDSFNKIMFNNYLYQIPQKTDEYLTYRYGNWQVPVKEWDTFTDDKAID